MPGHAGADDASPPLGVELAGADHVRGDVAQLPSEPGGARQLLQPGHLAAGAVIRVEEPAAGAQDPRTSRRKAASSPQACDASTLTATSTARSRRGKRSAFARTKERLATGAYRRRQKAIACAE